MPPHLDELDQIYLWGAQVFGENPSEFKVASGSALMATRMGWIGFLDNAKQIFETYGDIPFVHWAPYEQTYLRRYVERFGDPRSAPLPVEANLLDLFDRDPGDSIVLPLPSLSLKVVEDYVGYKRKQTEYGGQWAMATFIEATEAANDEKRNELMDKIVAYNKEDLEAMWAVFEWLRGRPR